MAAEQVSAGDGFVVASFNSEWYKNLKHSGSCLRLLALLLEKKELIHELGPKGTTVLHKGVQHGCVKLVKFILVDMFDGNGNCTCGLYAADKCGMTREGLVGKRCEYGSTAVNMVLVSGSPKMVLLLKWAIDMSNGKNREATSMSNDDEDVPDDWFESWNDTAEINSCIMRENVRSNGELPTDKPGNDLVIPDVKDDAIDGIYESGSTNSVMVPGVYTIMERVLDEDWGTDQELVDKLKDRCQKHVDFEFVPVPHVFLHFLETLTWGGIENAELYGDSKKYIDYLLFKNIRRKILKRMLELCIQTDSKGADMGGAMIVALFNVLDPRGRTILHAACANDQLKILRDGELCTMLASGRLKLSAQESKECWNAKDGAGRTVLHLLCIYDSSLDTTLVRQDVLDWEATLTPLCPNQFKTLHKWSFPNLELWECRPMHLAVLFNSERILNEYATYTREKDDVNASSNYHMQDAALLGRLKFLEYVLENHGEFNYRPGFYSDSGGVLKTIGLLPAIHCAALSGQVEAIQTILKHPGYDATIQHPEHGTALHLILKRPNMEKTLEQYDTLALLHVLPTSGRYNIIGNFKQLYHDKTPTMFSANEMTCINLLLQAGIDIWTPNKSNKELPTPGPMLNNEARIWWYDKVFKQVVAAKESISGAANATSVVAALVATASFIGPLTPPLSYTGDGGHIDTSVCAVRIYVVCISLSFYFSIASILLAVLPAIPMPKVSTFDELFRSQRCLKGATLMLLVAIVCILIGFSSASMAVETTAWHDQRLIVSSIVIGGMVCLVVLVIYIIRMLRLWFYKSKKFRRWFAEHMYF